MKEAAFTSFHEIESLKQEMYGANSKEWIFGANLLLTPMFIVKSSRILGFEGLDGSYKKN